MNKKVVFLFLLIALPVIIFLFLKTFGKNEFVIPVYYEQGLGDSLSTPCLNKAKEQYVVNTKEVSDKGIKVVHFERLDGPVLKTRLEALERVQDVFYEFDNVSLTTYLNGETIKAKDITDYNKRIQFLDQFWKVRELASEEWKKLKLCNMAMTNLDNRVVLIDTKNRIRGYYNILERDETDRLILEIKILNTEE